MANLKVCAPPATVFDPAMYCGPCSTLICPPWTAPVANIQAAGVANRIAIAALFLVSTGITHFLHRYARQRYVQCETFHVYLSSRLSLPPPCPPTLTGLVTRLARRDVRDVRLIAETEIRTSQHGHGHGSGSAAVVPTVGPLPDDDRFSAPAGESTSGGAAAAGDAPLIHWRSSRGGDDVDDGAAPAAAADAEVGGAGGAGASASSTSQKAPAAPSPSPSLSLSLSPSHPLNEPFPFPAVTKVGAALGPPGCLAAPHTRPHVLCPLRVQAAPPAILGARGLAYATVGDAARSRLINDVTMNKALSIIGAVVGWYCFIFIGTPAWK